jgi:hypothetical protein
MPDEPAPDSLYEEDKRRLAASDEGFDVRLAAFVATLDRLVTLAEFYVGKGTGKDSVVPKS